MNAQAIGVALAIGAFVIPAIAQTEAPKYPPSQQYDPGAAGAKPDAKALPNDETGAAPDQSGETGAATGEEGAMSPDQGASGAYEKPPANESGPADQAPSK